MEAGQRIVSMQADQCGKRRHRRGITSLELSESFEILRDLWRLVGGCRQRLEGSERLAAPAQDQVADRPALEIRRRSGNHGTDANPGPQKLVGGLQPRRSVDGVAMGCVVEKAAAAEIANQCRARVNADSGHPEIYAFG